MIDAWERVLSEVVLIEENAETLQKLREEKVLYIDPQGGPLRETFMIGVPLKGKS